VARADSCSLDSASGILDVEIYAINQLRLSAGGIIYLGGAVCATPTEVSSIRVRARPDVASSSQTLTIRKGTFGPGRDAEIDEPEIEISIDLGPDTGTVDRVVFLGTTGPDAYLFTARGLRTNGDADEDVTFDDDTLRVAVSGDAGADVIDASAFTIASGTERWGGDGNDWLIGSPGPDAIMGERGRDVLEGLGGPDLFRDGPGLDQIFGGDGDDTIVSDDHVGAAEPYRPRGDEISGGPGVDEVSYGLRVAPVMVTIDGNPDDGEAGENENVQLDVENVVGGKKADVLVGSSEPNKLSGGNGDDELYGGDGDDILAGQAGSDVLVGDGGDDTLKGGVGNDTLDGGAGADLYLGQDGDDLILNGDGIAETVDCGEGLDDAEPDPLDTLIGCEA
jgi:Ca2+-binding RTX toxin-like protein